jgi:hypothetical protein
LEEHVLNDICAAKTHSSAVDRVKNALLVIVVGKINNNKNMIIVIREVVEQLYPLIHSNLIHTLGKEFIALCTLLLESSVGSSFRVIFVSDDTLEVFTIHPGVFYFSQIIRLRSAIFIKQAVLQFGIA